MDVLIFGLAAFFNMAILIYKFNNGHYIELGVDIAMLMFLSAIFAGTATGMAIAMIGSALTSIYLIFFPPNLSIFSDKNNKKINNNDKYFTEVW